MGKFVPQYSFGRGEVGPTFYGRADLQQLQIALKKAENWIVLRSGGLVNRPGTKFIGETKDSSKRARLIPFQYNTEQAYALEFGEYYMRVVKSGGYVVLASTPTAWASATPYAVGDHASNAGTNYYCTTAHTSGTFATDLSAGKWHALEGLIVEIPTPYPVADLPLLKFVQSADTMTLTHSSHSQRELARYSHTKWVMSSPSFTVPLSAPSSVAVAASIAGGGTLAAPDSYSSAYYYVLTTVDADGNESLPSTAVGVLSKTFGYGTGTPTAYPKQTITWTNDASSAQINIYRKYQGLYALIGTVDYPDATFSDDNITPDPAYGPPISNNPFVTKGYPQCSTYYEQRIVYGGLASSVQDLALSKTGSFHNFYKSEPLKDSDGFTRTIAARKVNEIRHLVAIRELMIFTSGGIWKGSAGGQSDSVAPNSFSIKQQLEVGVSHVPPLVINDRVLFVQEMGSIIRDIGYDFARDNYSGDDLSLFSPHMFDGYEVKEWAYACIPNSVVYIVRDDGVLISMTYLKEQQLCALTRIITDGEFESVCSIPEGNEDAIYAIVKRTVDGSVKRYVERFASRLVTDAEDGFFVDCGLTYDGTPVDTVSGLDHLEGCTVTILADGNVQPPQVVTSGSVTLPVEASVIHVGLPYESTGETLPIGDIQGGIGVRKKAVRVRARVVNSRGMWIGPDEDNLTELKRADWTSDLVTEEIEIGIVPAYKEDATIVFKQKDPLPLSLLCLLPEVES